MSSISALLDIKKASTQKEALKASWDADFEENCNKFSDTLASNIAQRLFKQFGQEISDPYKMKIGVENKFRKKVDFDILNDKQSLETLIGLVEEVKELPPFREWLSTFSEKTSSTNLDIRYFEAKVAKVTKTVSEKLQEILIEYSSVPENRNLQFKVSYETPETPGFIKASSFAKNNIFLDLWLETPAVPVESKPSSGLIEKYKISRFCSTNLKKTMIAVVLVAFLMELIYLRFNSQLTFEGRMRLV